MIAEKVMRIDLSFTPEQLRWMKLALDAEALLQAARGTQTQYNEVARLRDQIAEECQQLTA